jgi:DNA-binding NarL/FixJ family response regulator
VVEAEATRVAGPADPARWATAVEALEEWGPPHHVAYGRWRWAEALLAARAPRAEAAAVLRPAHAIAQRLGAAAVGAEIEAVARRARLDLTVTERPAPPPSPADELGLTARELDVLEQLVAGATNRQIADALFISVKTAGVHVSNILRKLDASTRGEAAAIAHRAGLLAGQHPRAGL